MPQRLPAVAGRRGGGCLHGRRRAFDVAFRQDVAQVVGQKVLFQSADGAVHQEFEPPRRRRVEGGLCRQHEEPDLPEILGVLGRDAAEAFVAAVAKAETVFALDDADAVEDAAPHVAGPFERIESVAGDEDRVPARLESAGERVVFGLAEEAASDGGHARECREQVDEDIFRIVALGARRGLRLAGSFERCGDLADVENEPPHRAVADQGEPVVDPGDVGLHAAGRARFRRAG